MLAAFGVDVLDPRTSLRRIWVLLNRLPPHAAQGGQPWSVEAELLAGLIDHVAYLTWVTGRIHGSHAGKPRPVPRPKPPRTARSGPERAVDGRAADRRPDGARGPVKAGSWADAARMLAGVSGVEVRHG